MARHWILGASAAALLATGALAASQPAPRAPARPRRTILHFGEDDIRGDITRPDGELVQAPRKVADQSLIRVRKSFLDRALAAPMRGN